MFQQKSFGQATGKTFLALAIASAFSANSYAGNTAHPFSYEADGNCYCTEFVALSSVARNVVPTPIGGQTVAQVCERLGTGPGLILDNGEYNHPAYADAQCGNGPAALDSDSDCTLLDADGNTSCGSTGPEWNIAEAYSKPVTEKAPLVEVGQTAAPVKTNAAPEMAGTEHTEVASQIQQSAAVSTNETEFRSENQNVSSVANQLRAFNESVNQPNSRTLSRSVADNTTAPSTNEVARTDENITIVESSFTSEPPETLPIAQTIVEEQLPLAETYTIRDADGRATGNSGIDLTIGVQEPTLGAAHAIGPDTSTHSLTQEEILNFPEIETVRIPEKITRTSGDISVSSDDSQLEYRQIIIIESDGSARRMTQDEIARLPLADSQPVISEELQTQTETATLVTEETLVEQLIVESVSETAKIEIPEPVIDAAVAQPRTPAPRIEYWRSNLDYTYIGLAPTGYDFGGGGVEVEASASNNLGFALTGSAGIADEYSEASLGISLYVAPFAHRTTDVVVSAGVETGQFDLGITDLEDTGGYIGGYIRTRPLSRLELTGGGRFSSYFEGDAVFIASGTLRITNKFNAFSKVEVGDNDQFSFGLRYFY